MLLLYLIGDCRTKCWSSNTLFNQRQHFRCVGLFWRFYLISNRVLFANLRSAPPVSVSQQQHLPHYPLHKDCWGFPSSIYFNMYPSMVWALWLPSKHLNPNIKDEQRSYSSEKRWMCWLASTERFCRNTDVFRLNILSYVFVGNVEKTYILILYIKNIETYNMTPGWFPSQV